MLGVRDTTTRDCCIVLLAPLFLAPAGILIAGVALATLSSTQIGVSTSREIRTVRLVEREREAYLIVAVETFRAAVTSSWEICAYVALCCDWSVLVKAHPGIYLFAGGYMGLEEGPPPHLDAITGSPRQNDLMRYYYDELEEGQGLCATLEDRYYDDDDDTTEDANSINPNIDCKDNDNLTCFAVDLNNNNYNDKSNNNDCGDNNNGSNDNNNISNNISNGDKNNNINNNNNNNGDDCDLRDDGDDLRIQVIQVVATYNNDHFAGCDVNIYSSDSDGSGRWVQRAPSTIFVIFSGGWPFGEGITLCKFMSCLCRRGSIALLQWDLGGKVAG
ncbi:hypothetical protein CBR_g21986 [Chara braunii]|uniref:Uncharacterized protein n=1 Tax=Chara braunii TaxID=69332 RepID=A0A388L1V4_CHABU|nr:hypothetical protein CBR_g21986 [Chara braunii]|eukprot:GBG76238.1 hypothetical protein CBR_g21986 [Chara braunii]